MNHLSLGIRLAVIIILGSLATVGSIIYAAYGALLKDISERKKIERMKNQFVSTVSHELRTPLISIAGAIGLLASGCSRR